LPHNRALISNISKLSRTIHQSIKEKHDNTKKHQYVSEVSGRCGDMNVGRIEVYEDKIINAEMKLG
jgi:hypothetical protein